MHIPDPNNDVSPLPDPRRISLIARKLHVASDPLSRYSRCDPARCVYVNCRWIFPAERTRYVDHPRRLNRSRVDLEASNGGAARQDSAALRYCNNYSNNYTRVLLLRISQAVVSGKNCNSLI